VRNTYVTYLLLEDIPEKFGAILYMHTLWHHSGWKGNGKRWTCV